MDGRLSWLGWLTYSGHYPQSGHMSTIDQAEIRQPKTDVLFTEPLTFLFTCWFVDWTKRLCIEGVDAADHRTEWIVSTRGRFGQSRQFGHGDWQRVDIDVDSSWRERVGFIRRPVNGFFIKWTGNQSERFVANWSLRICCQVCCPHGWCRH